MYKKILAFFLVLMLVFTACSCGPTKDAPIDSEWEFVKLTMDGEVTTRKDVDTNDAPKFAVIDDENCVFSLLGKDHPGILEEENGVYYVTFKDGDNVGERALEITIKGNEMSIQFLPIDCKVIMKAK